MEGVNASKRMDAAFSSKSKNIMKQVADAIMDNVDDDEWKKCCLLQLESSMKNCIKADAVVEEIYKFTGEIFEKSTSEAQFSIADYTQKFESKRDKLKSSNLDKYCDKDDDLAGLRSILKQIACKDENVTVTDEEDEVMATQQDINLVDPISKKLMEDPVRHTQCGHVYERTSIMQMIKQGRRRGAKCPYMGCGYREAIDPHDLEVALDYRKEIQRRKRIGNYNN